MESIHLTSKKWQSKDIGLGTVVSLYKALIQYDSRMRDMYDVYKTKAKLKTENMRISQ